MSERTIRTNLISSVRKNGDALVASIIGEVDLGNSPVLRAALMDLIARHAPKKLILNLRHVQYMDSSAIAVLVEAVRKVGKPGQVALTDLQPRVKGLLEIARLDTIFQITGTEQEALEK
ncbi:MAG: STAS domain-containing protein [Planctomycetota bacterium]|nr:STAS domain-containing protein [Planctomycetota bacterium]